MRVKGTGLEDHGNVALGRLDVVHHPATDADTAAAERFKAGDQPQDGALAAAARADDHHPFAVTNVQGQVRDRRCAVRIHPAARRRAGPWPYGATTTKRGPPHGGRRTD